MAHEVTNITNEREFTDAPNEGMAAIEKLLDEHFPGLPSFVIVIQPSEVSGSDCMTFVNGNHYSIGTILVDFGRYLMAQNTQ